ncbi:MAG: alpha/beta fold hydrolase [Thiobacillaceae bacterium]
MVNRFKFRLRCLHVPKTTALDSTLPAIRLRGYAFHAETFGSPDNPPLIIVHGGPGGDYAYLLALQALLDEYHILFYDQRGSGRSPREATPDGSMDAFVRDLDAFIDFHGAGKPVRLIGHSWGGMIVTAYLARWGNKVSHALIAEPGMLHPDSAKAMAAALRRYQTFWRGFSMLPIIARYPFIASEDGHEPMDYIATKIMEASSGPPYHCVGEMLPRNTFRRAGYALMKATVIPLLADPSRFRDDYTQGLDNYTGRLMLLSGSCSFIGYDFQERYHRPRLPAHTEHRVIHGTGHYMFTMKPAESLKVTRPFLRA